MASNYAVGQIMWSPTDLGAGWRSLGGGAYEYNGVSLGSGASAPATTTYSTPDYSTSTATSSAPTIDTSTLNQYDQAIGNINSAIGRLPDQLDSGNQAIQTSYTDALNQLLAGKNQAQSTYDTNKHDTAVDFVGGKNTIRSNAGTSLNSLLRILGARGAGGGSAATISAPGAVTRNATIQQTDLGNTFGQNNRALDTNWGNYLTGYKNEVSSAGSQRQQQRDDLLRQVENSRASLLQSLGILTGQRASVAGGDATGAAQPYLDQANTLLDRASNYTTAPIKYNVQAYKAPDLSKYTVNPNGAPTVNGQAPSNDYASPFLAALLGKKQPQPVGG